MVVSAYFLIERSLGSCYLPTMSHHGSLKHQSKINVRKKDIITVQKIKIKSQLLKSHENGVKR